MQVVAALSAAVVVAAFPVVVVVVQVRVQREVEAVVPVLVAPMVQV